MLIPIKPPASHVVALAFEGDITMEDVTAVVEMLEEAMESNERVNILLDLTRLTGIKPSAVLKDLAFGLRNLGRLYRFQQMAVITDNDSVGKVVEWEDWLFRSIDIKRFSSVDRESALHWVEQRLELPAPGFAYTNQGALLLLEIKERMTGYDVTRLGDILRQHYEEFGPVRLMVKADGVPKLGEGVLYEKMRQFKLLSLMARCAIVGPNNLAGQVKAFNTVLNTRLKHFSVDSEAEAQAWVLDETPSVEVLPTDSDYQFALRISGKITSVEIESSYAALLPHLRGDNSMDLLLEVPYQDGITFQAMVKAVGLGIKHFSKLTQGIRRLALITDSRLLSKATEVENLLIPSIEERPFTFAQRDIALAWLAEGRPLLSPPITQLLPPGVAD